MLLIADEVQTGLGRTGALWGVNHWDVVPDIITSAKALGGGVMPIGAFIAGPKVWQPFIDDPFFHTTTTGGNPLACAAAIATINVVLEEDLPRQAAEKGDYMLERLKPLAERYDSIYERITGKGLLIGQHFRTPELGYEVSAGLFRRGVLISGTLTSAKTVRIEPPLVIEYDEIDAILDRLEDTLQGDERRARDRRCAPVSRSRLPLSQRQRRHSNGHSKSHAGAPSGQKWPRHATRKAERS